MAVPHARLEAAIRRETSQVRQLFHQKLDAFLDTTDPASGLPVLDVLTAYASQGYALDVTVSVRPPENAG